MNVIKPDIVVIGNRHYRKNNSYQNFNFGDSSSAPGELKPYEEETDDMYMDTRSSRMQENEYEDEECGLDCKIKPISRSDNRDEFSGIEKDNDQFKLLMEIPEVYYGKIIGRQGENKMRLETETKTRIKIPKKGDSSQLVEIKGKNKSDIVSCKNRLQILVQSARSQKAFTHMLMLPIVSDQMKSKFNAFRRSVLEKCSQERGIDETLFQNPNKLHLTICILTLVNENEIDQAKTILASCQKEFVNDLTNNKELKVSLKGLEYMNDDPSEVDVLYAKINPVDDSRQPPSIQQLADKLMSRFVDAGLAKKQYDRVKLHATVMNTLFRQDTSGMNDEKQSKSRDFKDRDRESFDARQILKNFGDFDFGILSLNEIHISIRFSSDSKTGFYDYVSKLQFNKK